MSRAKAQALLTECFGPFGPIRFPYRKMGKIDSLHLFGDTELMILAIYQHNRHRWKSVLDIGANLGLHSICMARLGWQVQAFEPDFAHFEQLMQNLEDNHVMKYVRPFMAAVHTQAGTAKFIRVLDNLTGNHLEGFKNSYGPTEMLLVPTVDCRLLWRGTDFAKIDSEGNEAELVKTMTEVDMERMSCILEVRNETNAQEIFDHFMAIKVPMWSQKTEWAQVEVFANMPKANREGSLFVGHQGPWA